MKILIAVDSFKGTLTSIEVAKIIKQNINNSGANVDIISIADGGEGTVESLLYATKGSKIKVNIQDAFGFTKESFFGLNESKDIAFVEIALSSGLVLIPEQELNPYLTSSYGLGETINLAIKQGIKKLVIGIGGSSSNDGGAGMLQALGVKFFDQDNQEIERLNGMSIADVKTIDTTNLNKKIFDVDIEVACDVTNPLLGVNGCSKVYSKQKGASKEMVLILEKNMEHFAEVVNEHIKKDYSKIPGSGAAGGIGFGLLSFLNAHLSSGLDVVADATNLEERIKKADIVITGEGSFDGQSLNGKVPVRVSKLARKHHKKIIGIFGSSTVNNIALFDQIYTVVPTIASIEESLSNPKETLGKLVQLIDCKATTKNPE